MHYDIELNSAAHYPVREIVELSPLIEQAGFGAFWKGESNSTDPFVLISAIAARTKTLKLGTAIYHIYGRSAVTLGIQSATLAGPLARTAAARSRRRQQDDRGLAQRRLRPAASPRARIYRDRAQSGGGRAHRIRGRDLQHRQALRAVLDAVLSAIPDLSRRSRSADDQARGQDLRRRVHQHGHARDDQGDRGPRSRRARSKRAAIPTVSRSSPRCACR